MYKQIATPRAYRNIVEQIEDSITTGKLKVGDQLPGERELATQFGVSRVVIREAMRYLEAKRIVEVQHGSGTYVRNEPNSVLSRDLTLLLQLEESSLLDYFVVRQALELAVVSRAAHFATEKDIINMQNSLAAMAAILNRAEAELEESGSENRICQEEDYLAVIEKDEMFHRMMAKASHNPPLSTLLDAILPLFSAGRAGLQCSDPRRYNCFASIDRLKVVYEAHSNIFTAIMNRDPKAAEHFLYTHLQHWAADWRNTGDE